MASRSWQNCPTDERLPGYPGFLAVIFALFGPMNFRAVMIVQILVDLGTCFIVADLARRVVSDRVARIAFVLVALCPFSRTTRRPLLTETLEVFFTAIALDCAAAGFDRLEREQVRWRAWVGSGLSVAACILRVHGPHSSGVHRSLSGVSNRQTLARSFQPVPALKALILVKPVRASSACALDTAQSSHPSSLPAARAHAYANEQEELAPRGFNRWVATWIIDYASVEEIYWSVPGDQIDADKLAVARLQFPGQRDETLALIGDYNQSTELTPTRARFGDLANSVCVNIPSVTLSSSRHCGSPTCGCDTDGTPTPDVRWWEFNDDLKASIMAVDSAW